MPRGRHRHSSPLHRLLPPSAIAGVSVVCASAPWVFSEATVLRALAAAAAATAVVGAFVMRRWDVQAGRRVAELTRARAGDEWRFEERVAELETDLEESRELRAKLEQRLRAKRAELAGLRNEHAALLRRYATAETERASALEGRRLLELEATVPEPAPARPTAPALPPARDGEPSRSAEAAPAAPAVFSPEGARLYRRALTALARFERRTPGEPGDGPEDRRDTAAETASEGDEPGANETGSRGAVTRETGAGEAVTGEAVTGEAGAAGPLAGEPAVVEPGAGTPGAATPVGGSARVPGQGASAGGEVTAGAVPVVGSASASGSVPVSGSASVSESASVSGSAPAPVAGSVPAPVAGAVSGAASASGVPSVAVGPVPEAPAPASGALAAPDSRPAPADPAQGAPDRPRGAVDAVPPAGGGPVMPSAGNLGVPPAVAVVPAAPARRPVTEGGFDFFGTQKGNPKAALDSVQNEDLADVVGPEALAVHKAEAEAGFKPADERSRGVGQIIDLTAHDETEQIDVQGLRSAAS
ncbi:hypothetical protein [Streptomyces eurythermus]|uniref:hypothetical protein n=1 Tax=Streptomyces eurythermus TaxID=42237 RepID=UPI00167B5682|nr:hypothetical protein [Streptomyces eurythermus]